MKPHILLSRGRWRGVTVQPPAPTPPPAPVEYSGHQYGASPDDGWTATSGLPSDSRNWGWTQWFQRTAGPGAAETIIELSGHRLAPDQSEYTAIWCGVADGRLRAYVNYEGPSIDLGPVAVGEKLFFAAAAIDGTMYMWRRPEASSAWVTGSAAIGKNFTIETWRRHRSGGGEVSRGIGAMSRIFSAGLDSAEVTAESASPTTVATGKTLTPTWSGQSTAVTVQFDIRLVGGTPAPAPAPAPEPPPPDPDPGTHFFFRSDSPWNADIPEHAVYYGPSDARTAGIRRTTVSSGTVVWAVNAQQDYAIPVHQAAPGGPTRVVRVQDYFGNPRRFDFYVEVPWPAGAVPATGTDKHFCVLDPDGVTSHDFWLLRQVGSEWVAASYSRTRLDGSGWNLFPYELESPSNPYGRNPAEAIAGVGAARAVSVALLGGLITEEDVDAGVINHAIGMAVPREFIRRGPRVHPADPTNGWYDGDASSTGPLAYSMRFALPRNLDIESLGLSSEWVMVADAWQRKGVFLFDVGGAGGRTGSIYTSYPGAHEFGMALRATQGYAFGQLIQRLEYVEWYP